METTTNKLRVILLAAITADGKMARNTSHLSDWTSPEDKRVFVAESKRAGVVILGNNTFKTLPRPLPGRLHIVLTTSTADKTDIPGVVEYTSNPPGAIVADLAARGYSSAVLAGGAQINTLFLAHNMVDEIWLTVEPIVFGTGVHVFEGAAFDQRLRLISLEQLNQNTFLAKYSTRVEEAAGTSNLTQPAPINHG
nr:RibD C-terminal domain protein [uncultured bacterium]